MVLYKIRNLRELLSRVSRATDRINERVRGELREAAGHCFDVALQAHYVARGSVARARMTYNSRLAL